MFTYDAVRSPYVGSISDLIAREGEIRARAAMASGQAWAGATQQVGQAVGGALQEIADPRRQMEDIALKNAKQTQAEQTNLRDLQTSKVPNGPQPEGAGPAAPQNPFLKAEGDVSVWDVDGLSKAMAARGTPLSPTSLKAITDLNSAHRDEMTARTAFGQAQTNLVAKAAGTMAEILRKTPGADPQQLAQLIGDQFQANQSFPLDKFKATMSQVLADPSQVLTKLDALSRLSSLPPVKMEKDTTLLNPNDLTAPPLASNMVKEPGKGQYTINGQRFEADGTPIGPAVAKQAEPPAAGSEAEAVQRARRQATVAKGGLALTDAEQQAVDTKAMQAYKEANADPELRAAALAQKNIAAALAKMQIDQAPTPEQAKSVADDLVHHRIAPEQLASLFSTRGREGLAFKLAVTAEAKKLDPAFNFEEASSEYALVKSPGFQNTVRYMDSVQESMPRLMENATKLGNGQFRTWNSVVNAAKGQFNSTDLKRFKTDALLVGDEVAKILSGGGSGSATSDAKLKQATDIISTSDSVPAIASALDEITTLIGFRRKAMTRGTYMEGTSANPAAVSGGFIEAIDPQGNVHHAPAGTPLPAGWKLK